MTSIETNVVCPVGMCFVDIICIQHQVDDGILARVLASLDDLWMIGYDRRPSLMMIGCLFSWEGKREI